MMNRDICILKKSNDKTVNTTLWKVGTIGMTLGVIVSGIIIWRRRGWIVC